MVEAAGGAGGAGAGVAMLLALVILWAVFRVKTADGSILVIEVNEPNADVFVDGEKVAVTWDKGSKRAEIGVKPGTKKPRGSRRRGSRSTVKRWKSRMGNAASYGATHHSGATQAGR